ncbi:[protein-PII] uridylyltransferase [Ilumatobacter sp.]|uniref:[protein-PII] uridylyltransferase n=1 Tax=Ilumatobacter sp. TaxID=1967498 RepID=UPI003B518AB4
MSPTLRSDHVEQASTGAIEPGVAAAAGARRGRDYCVALATITDRWVIELFESALRENPNESRVALLAVGGYGRGELAPFSDLDLLLVHGARPRRVSTEIEPIASAIWYPLWDSGVKLGHAVRRVVEQVDLVDGDLDSATALLTARYLAGDTEIAAEVTARGRSAWAANRTSYLSSLRQRMRERQAESADVAYRLEPDLKDGHGGLRDVQTVWWAIASGLDVFDRDVSELDDHYDTLLRARVALHLATERPGDVMRLEDQDAIASCGGWSDADAMMADVAEAGRNVSWLCDEAWNRVGDRDRAADRPIAPGVVLHDGEISLTEGADPRQAPALTLQAAVAAARHECRISRGTLERFEAEVEPWPDRWPVGALNELVALLLEGHRAIPVLEALDHSGLIGRLLPEWEPVRSKPQRNAYHRFTVDRHLWEAAANAAALVEHVGRPDLLVVGALLHDIGKGSPGDHTEVGMDLVREIGPRLGFDRRDTATLVAMVEHHLLLSEIAMRRDIADPATIDLLAGLVGSVERLELLRALTEADSLATGPSAWGSWKEGLIDELTVRTRQVLGGGDPTEAVWRLFPDAETLARMAIGEVDLRLDDDLVTIVAPDTTGSFSQVAGVLSLHGLDVLTARAHSDAHSMAASQFRIRPGSGELRWEPLERDLRAGLAHELAIEARLVERAMTYNRRRRQQAAAPGPPEVKFIEGASSDATVIEVRAVSKIGILHRIAKALGEMGLDIRHATVHTLGMEVVDTFYVRTWSGELVNGVEHRGEIRRALLHAVG